MSISNWYFKINDKRILMDAYITRVPEASFTPSALYPNDLSTYTKGHDSIDVPSITKVQKALVGTSSTCCSSDTAISTTAGTPPPGRS